MNKPAFVLAAASLALAATTVYLVHEIHRERELLTSAGESGSFATLANARGSRFASSRNAAERPATGIAASSGSSQPASDVGNRGRAPPEVRARLQSEGLVRMYKDPLLRRELVEERIPNLRDQYIRLQHKLEVDESTWRRLLEILAAEQLGFEAGTIDCEATDTCKRLDPVDGIAVTTRRQVAEVLGEKHAEELYLFRDSQSERQSLRALQLELPERQRLPDDRAEEVVLALTKFRADTVKQMVRESTPIGIFVGRSGTVLLYDKSLSSPEARIADAKSYTERLRQHARKHVPAGLQATYDGQLEATLEQMRAAARKPQ